MYATNQETIDILSQTVLDLDKYEILVDGQEAILKGGKFTTTGSLYTPVMTLLEVEVAGEHEPNKVHLERYVASEAISQDVQIINYGDFIVRETEYDEVADTTKLTAYDAMILAQVPYEVQEVGLAFPNSVAITLEVVAEYMGLEFDNQIGTGADRIIDADYWATDLSYTLRDILNDICELTASTLAIRNGKLTLFKSVDTGVELQGYSALKIKEYHSTNLLNIAYEPQHDNTFAPAGAIDPDSPEFIPLDDRSEVVFENNPIFLGNEQFYADELLLELTDEYSIGEITTYHIGVFQVGDKFEVAGKTFLVTEMSFNLTNVRVEIKSERPTAYKDQYVVETDQKRQGQETSFEVNKLDGEIRATIERVENLVIDAENRLYQSKTHIPLYFKTGTGTLQLIRESANPYYKATTSGTIGLFGSFPNSQFAENLEGEIVTISIDVMVDVDRTVYIDDRAYDVKGNRWNRIHITKEFPENTSRNTRVRVPYSRKRTRDLINRTELFTLSTDLNTLYYRNLQFQKGEVASNHTLTPEELEADIQRLGTEILQLVDSISAVAQRNENTGRLEITPETIVQAIETTDGVGKVKTVKVTVDENGLTVDDGALIIRDAQNTAIITSAGLKIMFIYTSSGELGGGWQFVGIRSVGGNVFKREAMISFAIPDKLTVTKATLQTMSMPALRSGESFPDGLYHARNLRLYKSTNALGGVLDYPAYSEYEIDLGSSSQDITTSTWGSSWSPTDGQIVVREADITNHIESGQQQIFSVTTTDAISAANARYMGAMQFTVVIEGFLRG